ncbi:MAG: AEC family transporter [Alphaproteobacteria bacterium]|nr:AEC family transporter [Alphaproteobacteria bacterium]
MLAVINVVLPVFGIMLAGYLCGRFALLGQGSSQALNGYVYYVALPALFFLSMSRVPVNQAFDPGFLGAYGGAAAILFIVAMVIARFAFPNRVGGLGLHAMSAIFANTGYMGIPLLLIAYGDAGRLPGIISSLFNGVLVMGVVTAILEIDAHAGSGFLAILRKIAIGVLRSPLMMSAAAGLLVSGFEVTLPPAFVTFCDLLGATAGPCALFAIGLFMVGKSIRAGLGEVMWVTLLKLVAQPLLTWWLAYEVFHLEATWAASAVIMAALPTGALSFVLAQRYVVYIERATSVILISTVLSVFTLTGIFLVIGVG